MLSIIGIIRSCKLHVLFQLYYFFSISDFSHFFIIWLLFLIFSLFFILDFYYLNEHNWSTKIKQNYVTITPIIYFSRKNVLLMICLSMVKISLVCGKIEVWVELKIEEQRETRSRIMALVYHITRMSMSGCI